MRHARGIVGQLCDLLRGNRRRRSPEERRISGEGSCYHVRRVWHIVFLVAVTEGQGRWLRLAKIDGSELELGGVILGPVRKVSGLATRMATFCARASSYEIGRHTDTKARGRYADGNAYGAFLLNEQPSSDPSAESLRTTGWHGSTGTPESELLRRRRGATHNNRAHRLPVSTLMIVHVKHEHSGTLNLKFESPCQVEATVWIDRHGTAPRTTEWFNSFLGVSNSRQTQPGTREQCRGIKCRREEAGPGALHILG
jgi:hypothetical protein